jgi:isopropylmalate/citramalate/homocitrate synthases
LKLLVAKISDDPYTLLKVVRYITQLPVNLQSFNLQKIGKILHLEAFIEGDDSVLQLLHKRVKKVIGVLEVCVLDEKEFEIKKVVVLNTKKEDLVKTYEFEHYRILTKNLDGSKIQLLDNDKRIAPLLASQDVNLISISSFLFLKMEEMKMRRIRVFDTTLRDGEQTPGVSLTPQEKLTIAEALDKLGVDVIEGGFPISSKSEEEALRAMCQAGFRAEVCGLARANKEDIERVVNCGARTVHVFLASSDIHLKHKLKMSRDEMLKRCDEMIRYAKSFGVKVEFSAEDSTRTDIDFFKKVVKVAYEAGADRFDIADTVGVATPEKMADYVRAAKSAAPILVSVHCHNDFGLAVANSLSAVVAGAEQAHVTVNGIGERAGNASLEEFVMACKSLYGFDVNINTKLLYDVSVLVSRLTGVIVQPNKAIVGRNSFGHESGIHTHGILSNPLTYEPFDPSLVGRSRWFQAGKHSGRHGIFEQVKSMGFEPTREQLDEIVKRVKALGDQGITVTESDLFQIASQVVGESELNSLLLELKDFEVSTGLGRPARVQLRLVYNGKETLLSGMGKNSIQACFDALKSFIGDRIEDIKSYTIKALVTDVGVDVTAEFVHKNGEFSSSRGESDELVSASIQAIVSALNLSIIKALRNRPLKTRQSG